MNWYRKLEGLASSLWREYGAAITPAEVAITTGCNHATQLAARTIQVSTPPSVLEDARFTSIVIFILASRLPYFQVGIILNESICCRFPFFLGDRMLVLFNGTHTHFGFLSKPEFPPFHRHRGHSFGQRLRTREWAKSRARGGDSRGFGSCNPKAR